MNPSSISNMKTPSEISKLGREEFEKKCVTKLGYISDTNYETGGFLTAKDIKSHITSQEVKILESVKEWAEENRKKAGLYIWNNGDKINYHREDDDTKRECYNQSISDLQSFLEEEIKKIHI